MDSQDEAEEDFYGNANAGDYFGELALIKGDAKPMSCWCVKNTHFLVLSRKTIEHTWQLLKHRDNQEKIHFLK